MPRRGASTHFIHVVNTTILAETHGVLRPERALAEEVDMKVLEEWTRHEAVQVVEEVFVNVLEIFVITVCRLDWAHKLRNSEPRQ